MAYYLNFPLAADYMRDSQPLMLANYGAIFDFMGADHVQFNAAGTPGQHLQMTFPGLNPMQVNSNGNWQLFALNIATDPLSTFLFSFNAAGLLKGFSRSNLSGNLGVANFIQLPSGILLKWITLATQASGAPNPFRLQWLNYGDLLPFTTQYWAGVFPLATFPNVIYDEDIVTYVTDISNPLQITFKLWSRYQFNTAPTYPSGFTILAIGV